MRTLLSTLSIDHSVLRSLTGLYLSAGRFSRCLVLGISISISLGATLLASPQFINPAKAAAYSTNSSPTLAEICHDLRIAFLSVASANQSAPNIGKALRLLNNATQGCQLNPRESIRKLQVALHLVTPL